MGQVLERLRADDQLTPQQVDRCAEYLEARRLHAVPWYIKAVTAIGAVIAAGIFASFISLVGYFIGPIPLGLLFVAGALILTHALDFTFTRDMAIAFSIGGQFAILYGVLEHDLFGQSYDDFWQLAVVAIILCASLYPFFTSSVHRFITCSVAIYLTVAWVLEAGQLHLLHLVILTEAVGATLMLANSRYYRWMKPLAYALATALPVTLLVLTSVSGGKNPGLGFDGIMTPLWPSNVTLAVGILVLLWWAADGAWDFFSEAEMIVLAAVVVLAVLTTPGVLAAIGLLVLGHVLSDRLIIALGVLFLPLFLGYYYYDLNVSLLAKSGILAGSGLVLLAARYLLGSRHWAESEMS